MNKWISPLLQGVQGSISAFPPKSRRQTGQALVEFSLTIVLLLTVLIGILEFGRIVWLYDTLSNLTREIARYTIAVQHQRESTGTITTSGTILGDVVPIYDTGLDSHYLIPGSLASMDSLPAPSLATAGIYISPGDSCRTRSDSLQADSVFGPNASGFSGHLDWFSYAREYQNCQDGSNNLPALQAIPPGTATLTVAIYYPLQADGLIPGFGPVNTIIATAETTMFFE
ncbi:MAG TPA: TadE/TadG family type IV pilus assembly protein [Ktedonobacterales bacterium]|nr:TadE/TadG family type IV pilus assembly protein [Ktedonobacterales bacterium]